MRAPEVRFGGGTSREGDSGSCCPPYINQTLSTRARLQILWILLRHQKPSELAFEPRHFQQKGQTLLFLLGDQGRRIEIGLGVVDSKHERRMPVACQDIAHDQR